MSILLCPNFYIYNLLSLKFGQSGITTGAISDSLIPAENLSASLPASMPTLRCMEDLPALVAMVVVSQHQILNGVHPQLKILETVLVATKDNLSAAAMTTVFSAFFFAAFSSWWGIWTRDWFSASGLFSCWSARLGKAVHHETCIRPFLIWRCFSFNTNSCVLFVGMVISSVD